MSRIRGATFSLAALLAAFGLARAVAAAELPRTLRFDTLSVEQGLQQESVLAMAQDRDGFLWIGTQAGLGRYDGYRTTVYDAVAADPSALVDNWVGALHEDERGRLWVGTRSGLQRFDRAREAFVTVHLPVAGPAGTTLPFVTALRDGAPGRGRGELWIGTTAGLFRLDADGRSRAWHADDARAGSLPSDDITSLAWDAAGRLW